MPVVVEMAYNVRFNDGPLWKINSDLVRYVDNAPFVKLRAWDYSFVRVVAHGVIEVPKGTRPSLASCEGFKALMKHRNEAMLVLNQEPSEPEEPSLFDPEVPQKAQSSLRPTRINAAKLQELREEPTAMEFMLPGGVITLRFL